MGDKEVVGEWGEEGTAFKGEEKERQNATKEEGTTNNWKEHAIERHN